MNEIFGYFDTPNQATPVFDPGLESLCPICLVVLKGQPLKTISLMKHGSNRSYFFRAHKDCWDMAGQTEKEQIEWSLIDSSPSRTKEISESNG